VCRLLQWYNLHEVKFPVSVSPYLDVRKLRFFNKIVVKVAMRYFIFSRRRV
jgi:hypothetical protein